MKHPVLDDALALEVATRVQDYYDEIDKAFNGAVERFRQSPTDQYEFNRIREHAQTLRVLRYVLTGSFGETK